MIEKERPELVIIDSIQTMYSEDVTSAPGSVSQVRESTNVFMQLAKGLCIPIFIVGHVTKEGTVAGPRVLEHMVDTVLYFEGDRHASYRILRAVKNRFGSTNEIGVFEMRQSGLVEVEIHRSICSVGNRRMLPGPLLHAPWKEQDRSFWKYRHWSAEQISECREEQQQEPIITGSTF